MRTLLLTPWYFPHKILRWEDAITMVFLEKADIVVAYDEVVRSPSTEFPLPAVIRLRKAVGNMKKGVKFSRVNVYTRDRFICQYCKHKFPMRALSYDHVIPRSAGGKTDWDNIVTACKTCNAIKADRTCDEAGMWPMNRPKKPKALPLTAPLIALEHAPEEWHPFLESSDR